MPRVALTAAQRQAQRWAAWSSALADGLLYYKAKHRMTSECLAKGLNIDNKTLRKLVDEQSVSLPLEKLWAVLEVAGLEVRRRGIQPQQGAETQGAAGGEVRNQ